MILTMSWSCLEKVKDLSAVLHLSFFFWMLFQAISDTRVSGWFCPNNRLDLWTVPFMLSVRIRLCGSVQALVSCIHTDLGLNSFQTGTGSCSASLEHRQHLCVIPVMFSVDIPSDMNEYFRCQKHERNCHSSGCVGIVSRHHPKSM